MSADICCGTGALGLCLAQVCFSVQYRSVGPYCNSAETVDIIDATIPIKIVHTHFLLVLENRFPRKVRTVWEHKNNFNNKLQEI